MIARRFFPGQPASLDALCRRFGVDNTNRTLHGALLDAELLCDVFIKMIEFLEDENRFEGKFDYKVKKQDTGTIKRNVNFGYRKFAVSNEEMEKHKEFLKSIGF
jgi:DNA polymerase-3 subunit epsilon